MQIRDATPADLDAVLAVYDHEVATSVTTFDLEPGDREVWLGKIRDGLFLVGEDDGRFVGFAYASQFRPRPAYHRTMESSVYLRADSLGRGFGTQLYAALLERLRATDCHTVLAVVALPNDGSLALHERFGFEPVGTMREVGDKLGRMVDVRLLQLLLR